MYIEITLILQGPVFQITLLNKIKHFSVATLVRKEEKQNFHFLVDIGGENMVQHELV